MTGPIVALHTGEVYFTPRNHVLVGPPAYCKFLVRYLPVWIYGDRNDAIIMQELTNLSELHGTAKLVAYEMFIKQRS